jgi:hypothetical protein
LPCRVNKGLDCLLRQKTEQETNSTAISSKFVSRLVCSSFEGSADACLRLIAHCLHMTIVSNILSSQHSAKLNKTSLLDDTQLYAVNVKVVHLAMCSEFTLVQSIQQRCSSTETDGIKNVVNMDRSNVLYGDFRQKIFQSSSTTC